MSWIHWRHAARALWRRPLFALSSTLVLALGIAAAVVVFTLVDAMLLRPPPVHEPERLLAIGTQPPPDAQWTSQTVAMPVVAEWRRAARTFDEIGGYVARQLAWSGPDGVERLEAGATVGDLFGVLGLRMALGRALTEGETGAAVLSHEFWQRRFGGRPSVLGETIVLDDISCAIVGVLPPETAMPLLAANVERLVWIASPGGAAGDRELVYVAGRLGPEASPEAAEAELEALQHAVEEQLAVENQALGVVLQTLQQQRFAIAGRALTSLFGGALVLLLIACANVGMLSLAQAAGRRHEMAVRSSLGAPRARLLGQAAAEHALLWCVGGVLGIAFAIAGLRAAAATNPFPILGSDAFLIDARVLLFALAATLVTAVLFGIAPALKLASSMPPK